MTRYYKPSLLAAILIAAATGFMAPALGQVREHLEVRTERPLGQGEALLSHARVDTVSGVYRALYRLEPERDPPISPQSAALRILEREAPQFGWIRAEDELHVVSVIESPGGLHLTYQQVLTGIPVYNRFVKLNLDSGNQPTMMLSGFAPHVAEHHGLIRNAPSLSATQAHRRALEWLSAETAHATEPELTIYPSATPKLGWHIVVWPADEPAEWNIVIDAQTGDILHMVNSATHSGAVSEKVHGSPASGSRQTALPPAQTIEQVNGTGYIFDPDPLTTAGALYGGVYTNNNDEDSNELNAERRLATLRDISRGDDQLHRLTGPHVAIVGRNNAHQITFTPPAEIHPDEFRYARADTSFEAVNVYYHIDTSQRYLQSLGFFSRQNQPIQANPRGTSGDVSNYFPVQNFLSYGTGGVNDGEDADVILHEYGHALLESGSSGLLQTQEGRAIHEGWSDYWAASYRRHLIESGAVPAADWRRLFTWDSGFDGIRGTYWPGRLIQHPGRYPADLTGNIYEDGLLLATTLMEIYDEVGRNASDALNLQAHHYLGSGSTMRDYGEALLQADRDLFGEAHRSILINLLVHRGLLDERAYAPVISHEPLIHTEEVGGTIEISASVSSPAGVIDSVFIAFRTSGDWTTSIMQPSGGATYTYDLELPAFPDTLWYYLEALDDASQRSSLPSDAPLEAFQLVIGEDREPPVIEHGPVPLASLDGWPVAISAGAEDNLGVDSVWVTYQVKGPQENVRLSGYFRLRLEDGIYVDSFPVPRDFMRADDVVSYRIHSRDVSSAGNIGAMPGEDEAPFSFPVFERGTVRHFNFDGPVAGLRAEGLWLRGSPAYGLMTPFSGKLSWGTVPDGPYHPVAQNSTLQLPPVDLSGQEAAYLVFSHWYETRERRDMDGKISGLFDGGNVKASIDGGNEWFVLYPGQDYAGKIESEIVNPLAGEPAFGGYSYGWQREVVPLPVSETIVIRFDFGTEQGDGMVGNSKAGWFIDEVSVTTKIPGDAHAPVFIEVPESILAAIPGNPPPSVSVKLADEVGLARVDAAYEGYSADGQPTLRDTTRFSMDPTDRFTFHGVMDIAGMDLRSGSHLDYILIARDYDGNVAVHPADGGRLRIEYRLLHSQEMLQHVRSSGLWESLHQYWRLCSCAFNASPSSLVLDAIELPANALESHFDLRHKYVVHPGAGGNVKISLDDGSSWHVLEPETGYPDRLQAGDVAWMDGQPVFAGSHDSEVMMSRFDLSEWAGRLIRLRIDFGTSRQLEDGETWEIQSGSLHYSTADDDFDIPRVLALHPNYPNPFSFETTIEFTLPERALVSLHLYDVTGRLVTTLVNEERMEGSYSLPLNGTNLATGLYFLRLVAGGEQRVRKVMIMR